MIPDLLHDETAIASTLRRRRADGVVVRVAELAGS
jgi:hypothetical protein